MKIENGVLKYIDELNCPHLVFPKDMTDIADEFYMSLGITDDIETIEEIIVTLTNGINDQSVVSRVNGKIKFHDAVATVNSVKEKRVEIFTGRHRIENEIVLHITIPLTNSVND